MRQRSSQDPAFPKQCGVCQYCWPSRDEFLNGTGLHLVGYQVSFENLVAGQFLFNHECGATLAVPASAFADLYDGPVFEDRATGTDDCPEYCIHGDNLDPCPAQCECAFVREILQIVRTRQGGSSYPAEAQESGSAGTSPTR